MASFVIPQPLPRQRLFSGEKLFPKRFMNTRIFMNMRVVPAILFVGAIVLTGSVALGADPGYHLLGKISLPGEGNQDYLYIDQTNRRLYVSHQTAVEVIDLDTEKPVGRIEGLDGV